MTQIPYFISYLITTLADLLTTDLIYPFVGIWVAAYVIYLFLSFFRRRS